MTTKAILQRAKATLLETGITDGCLVRDTPDGRCYCSLGALALASGHTVIPDPNDGRDILFGYPSLTFNTCTDGSYNQLSALPAVQALARTIDPMKAARPEAETDGSWLAIIVSSFNDSNVINGKTQRIFDVFDEAIASLD